MRYGFKKGTFFSAFLEAVPLFFLVKTESSIYEKSLFVMNRLFLVGILGLEPRMTGPESVVLPLHHIPMFKIKMLLF